MWSFKTVQKVNVVIDAAFTMCTTLYHAVAGMTSRMSARQHAAFRFLRRAW
jgi:hypothetical protein